MTMAAIQAAHAQNMRNAKHYIAIINLSQNRLGIKRFYFVPVTIINGTVKVSSVLDKINAKIANFVKTVDDTAQPVSVKSLICFKNGSWRSELKDDTFQSGPPIFFATGNLDDINEAQQFELVGYLNVPKGILGGIKETIAWLTTFDTIRAYADKIKASTTLSLQDFKNLKIFYSAPLDLLKKTQ
jgi:hypothetical protein